LKVTHILSYIRLIDSKTPTIIQDDSIEEVVEDSMPN
jgi:hypothetical protein